MRFSSFLLRSIPRETISSRRWCQSNSDNFTLSKTTTKKPRQNLDLFAFYSTSSTFKSYKHQYARFSATSTIKKEAENKNQLEVEIISEEFIKPTSPTPQHSKMFEVSLLDQLFPNMYVPFVYFYPNHNKNDSQSINHNHNDLIMKRRQLLKQSLSQLLTRFYPLAGRVKGSRHIECNDDGVHYIEAKVPNFLCDFLKHPDNKSIHHLLPLHPDSIKLRSITDMAMVQVTLFSCGGMAIGIYTSHKILDGYSIATFVRAWSETARACQQQICPKFISPSIFPSNPKLSENSSIPMFAQIKTTTKRFLFDAPSLATLKKETRSSRVTALKAFIWKCLMATSKYYSSLTMTVNLRARSSPPMPPYCIGNIIWNTDPILGSVDDDLRLDSLAQRINNSINKINKDSIQEMKGEGFAFNMKKSLNEKKMFYSNQKFKHIFMTSLINTGTYNADFGFGKPIWASFSLSDVEIPFIENYVVLMDTRSGDGMELWVTLPNEDMAIFEHNPELLSLASVDPNPLNQHVV